MAGEAVTQHLVGILDDDEGIGVDADHQILQVRQLALLHGAEDDLGIVAGIVALGVENIMLTPDLKENFLFIGKSSTILSVSSQISII